MKNSKITHGLSFRLTKFVEGLLLGFLSLLPFLDTQRLREIFEDKEDQFLPYSKRINSYLGQNITTLLGVFIGLLCFFYIPITSLLNMMGKPIYLFLMALSSFFIITDIYLLFRNNYIEDKKASKIITLIVLFILGLAIPFAFNFLKINTKLDAALNSTNNILIFSGIMIVAGVLSQYSGYSLGSLLAISSLYLSLSTPLYDVMRLKDIKSYLVFIAVILLSYGIGLTIGFIIKARRKTEKNRSTLNLGLTISTLYFFYTNNFKNATYNLSFQDEKITSQMKLFLTLTAIAIGIIISFVLTIHNYRFLNKKETQELERNQNYNMTILTDRLKNKNQEIL